MKRTDVLDALEAELERFGCTDYWVEQGRVHQRLYFRWDGRVRFYVLGVSPSDRRARDNALSGLRKVMGVQRQVRKSCRARQRKRATETAPECPALTVGNDPFATLADLKAVLEERARPWWRRAWDRLKALAAKMRKEKDDGLAAD